MQLAHHKQLTSLNYFKNPLKLMIKLLFETLVNIHLQNIIIRYFQIYIFLVYYSSGPFIFRDLFLKSQWFYYFIVYLRNWICFKINTEVNTFYLKSTTKQFMDESYP